MRTIKVNQIKSVLDEYSSRLSNGKVYSVLFVSELGDPSMTIEELESWLNEEKSRYDLAKIVLDHARFDFVPKRLEGVYDSVTGTATDGFSPIFCCTFTGIMQ